MKCENCWCSCERKERDSRFNIKDAGRDVHDHDCDCEHDRGHGRERSWQLLELGMGKGGVIVEH